MTEPDDAATGRAAQRDARAAAQQAKAEQTLRAIFAGGDLTAETMQLSNDFTDELTGRLTSRLRGTRTERPAPEASTEGSNDPD